MCVTYYLWWRSWAWIKMDHQKNNTFYSRLILLRVNAGYFWALGLSYEWTKPLRSTNKPFIWKYNGSDRVQTSDFIYTYIFEKGSNTHIYKMRKLMSNIDYDVDTLFYTIILFVFVLLKLLRNSHFHMLNVKI